ncbi:hypothetical protein K466DRAFT_554991, partial [Polyporus arcularius HHB13444]
MSLQTNTEHANVSGTQAPKRQKVDAPIATSSSKSLKSLSGLPDLPIDILFEIFSNIAPKDLLHLSRTTQAFRQLLLDRRSTTVWKAARQRTFPGAPECPEDVSEPFWANLVFGDAVCGNCGAKNIRRVFFELRRRLCASCIKKNSVKPNQLKSRFPDYDEGILQLVPYVTGVGGGGANVKQYWIADVVEMAEKMAKLQEAMDKGSPDSAQTIEDFKSEQIARVEARFEDAARCYDGMHGRGETLQEMKEARLTEICSRFVALGLGYEESDVRLACRDLKLLAAPLTDRAWKAIKKERESMVRFHREWRVEHQYQDVRRARRKIIEKLYNRYYFDIKPLDIFTVPELRQVCGFPEFLEVVNSDHTREVVPEDFAAAMKKLPDRITGWQKKMETYLVDRIPQAWEYTRLGPECWDATAPTMKHEVSSLELATYITTCDYHEHCPNGKFAPRKDRGDWCGDVAFGRRETFGHLMHDSDLGHLPPREPLWYDVKFSMEGYALATRLVKSLGLDPSTITVLQMDRQEAWFTCATCDPEEIAGTSYRAVMDWRLLVNHYLDENEKGNGEHRWCRLDEAKSELIRKADDEARDDPQHTIWCCGHCSSFLFKPKDIMLKHVRLGHGITESMEERNYFREVVRPGALAPKPLHYISRDGKIHSTHITFDPPVS